MSDKGLFLYKFKDTSFRSVREKDKPTNPAFKNSQVALVSCDNVRWQNPYVRKRSQYRRHYDTALAPTDLLRMCQEDLLHVTTSH